ncbi:MAG TPA: nitrophenyl compound nitroreductase subunit ArsF family protein [Armatimonadota bacterium]|jgi:hypothetical protein
MIIKSIGKAIAFAIAGALAYNALTPKPRGAACYGGPLISVANARLSSTAKSEPRLQRKLIAYYFHGNYRCASCRTIEAWTNKAIRDNFPAELKAGRLEWRVVNVETAGNEHYMKDYKLFTKSVVLSDVRNGKEAKWKNLDKVWTLLRDEAAFKSYVRDEVKASLKAK